MQCERCNGEVTWRGPLSALTHTECGSCGGINCQRVSGQEEPDDDIDPEPCQSDYGEPRDKRAQWKQEVAGSRFNQKTTKMAHNKRQSLR